MGRCANAVLILNDIKKTRTHHPDNMTAQHSRQTSSCTSADEQGERVHVECRSLSRNRAGHTETDPITTSTTAHTPTLLVHSWPGKRCPSGSPHHFSNFPTNENDKRKKIGQRRHMIRCEGDIESIPRWLRSAAPARSVWPPTVSCLMNRWGEANQAREMKETVPHPVFLLFDFAAQWKFWTPSACPRRLSPSIKTQILEDRDERRMTSFNFDGDGGGGDVRKSPSHNSSSSSLLCSSLLAHRLSVAGDGLNNGERNLIVV